MGVAQHHDAVSGTEKQVVVFDYAQRLSDGIDAAQVCSNNNISMFLDSLLRSSNFIETFVSI
jgi:hypothetical protein